MAKEDMASKMLAIILIVVISIAAIVVLYVNLPQENEVEDGTTDGQTEDNESVIPETLLTVTYNNTDYEYTFSEIENFTSITGTARTLKWGYYESTGTVIIDPPMNETANQYTGVKVQTILEEIENLPETYNVTISAEGYEQEFNSTEINGYIKTYNETANATYVEASVVLSYKENGEYLSEDNGPLMVAIVGDEPISPSDRWVTNVVSIEITE